MGAGALRPRFDGPCRSPPAVVVLKPARNAGMSTMTNAHVGSIAIRSGNPESTDPWQWHCGFYPGSRPGECTSGTAVTFGQARAAFESAWRGFLSKRTEADFQALGNIGLGPVGSMRTSFPGSA